MVAYVASQTLTHNEIIAEDEQGANIWDMLTRWPPSRQARPSGTFWDVGEQPEEELQDDEHEYGYDEEEEEETVRAATRRRPRPNVLDDDQEPFNTPESSAEHSLFITQADPEPYHEPGTLSRTQKGKTPVG